MSGTHTRTAEGRGINYRTLDDLFAIRDSRQDEVRAWSLWGGAVQRQQPVALGGGQHAEDPSSHEATASRTSWPTPSPTPHHTTRVCNPLNT
jgi:hypothetical protein